MIFAPVCAFITLVKIKCQIAHTGAKTNFLSRNYQEFDVWKMWILWKMRLWKCEFYEKGDFQNVNVWTNCVFCPIVITVFWKNSPGKWSRLFLWNFPLFFRPRWSCGQWQRGRHERENFVFPSNFQHQQWSFWRRGAF